MSSLSLSRVWNAPQTFWALLALPAMPMLGSLLTGDLRHVVGPSGEFGARFLIISLMLTPLMMLFPKSRAMRWLTKRRRAIGVAAFFYGALHLVAYALHEGSLAKILADLPHPAILAGWIALAVFVPLAVTSNDSALRAMGTAWKKLQRFAYLAGVAVLAHWLLISHEGGAALVQFAPLAALTLYRLGRNMHWWNYRFAGA